jgi:hypothetical protein
VLFDFPTDLIISENSTSRRGFAIVPLSPRQFLNIAWCITNLNYNESCFSNVVANDGEERQGLKIRVSISA